MKNLLRLTVLAALSGTCADAAGPSTQGALPWPLESGTWRTDPAWYDGKAEKCVYEATRTIYGLERSYPATAYTNKEQVDRASTVKLASGDDLECFKHHWSERVPTENYDYDFSTSSYVTCAELAPFKLTAATQEDCGASFKQLWRVRNELRYWESVYFPGAGMRSGSLPAGQLVLEDSLPLVLRDLPFERSQGDQRLGYVLRLLPSQKDTHAVPWEPLEVSVVVVPGPETLSLPCGELAAYRVDVDVEGAPRASYWFAAEAAAPWLHALVQYEQVGGAAVRYRLRSLERTAYWERPPR